MTFLNSPLLTQAGFHHGFGTRRATADDYPADIHILKQIHGERVVVLTRVPMSGRQGTGENPGSKCESAAGKATGNTRPGGTMDFVCRELPHSPFRFDEGDAMVTDIPGISIGIRTADCLPVLLGDRSCGAVAAIHCGWRSLALGLAGKAARALINLKGSDPDAILAATGPSINTCCYEVGEDVRNALIESGHSEAGLFETRGDGTYLNLRAAARAQFVAAGMLSQNIEDITGCTMCKRDLFWSYRGGEREKRMVSWITARQG